MKKIDPITVSVIENRLDTITKEIGETMLRTSRSPIFSEGRDFATAILDKDGRLIAQTAYIPILMGAMPYGFKSILDKFGDNIHEGDIFLSNDPYRALGTHLPDFLVAKPVFYRGELLFWSAGKGHHADIGGSGICGYNPLARTIWEDGIRIPPVKIYEKGSVVRDVWDLLLLNVRIPHLVEGDLHCQVGAVTIGERGLISLLNRYGAETLLGAVEEIYSASEKHVRAEIRKIPNGSYTGEAFVDNDGIENRLVKVVVKITKKDEDIIFDYSDSDPQVQGFLNSPLTNTISTTYVAFFPCIDPNIRINDGSVRQIKIIAPLGSLFNPVEPAAVTECTLSTAAAAIDAIWTALYQAIPDRVQAGWARNRSIVSKGFNPRTGKLFADIHFFHKGGGGATAGCDGWDHLGIVVCLGGLRSPDPELHEMINPYTLVKYELLPDSAGPGKWRGGFGIDYRWKVNADHISCCTHGSGSKEQTVPFGLNNGGKGIKSRQIVRRKNGSQSEIGMNVFYEVNQGDEVELYASGGGGFGDPFERPVEKVFQDVRDGLISIDHAKKDYGVVIDLEGGELTINDDETAQIRGNKHHH